MGYQRRVHGESRSTSSCATRQFQERKGVRHIGPNSTMTTIFHNRELRYERDMLGAIQGGGEARPTVGIPLVGRREDAKSGQGLENAMQGLILSQQPSLLPTSVLPHNLPCLDSLANQVSSMEMSEEMEVGRNAGGQQHQQHQGVGTQEEMEAPSNPAYRQYLADRAEEERRAAGEMMMPTSMMAHCILPTNQQQHQLMLYQQFGMVHQHQHQQAENLQLAQRLGGSSLISSQPDLVPVLSSLHLV